MYSLWPCTTAFQAPLLGVGPGSESVRLHVPVFSMMVNFLPAVLPTDCMPPMAAKYVGWKHATATATTNHRVATPNPPKPPVQSYENLS